MKNISIVILFFIVFCNFSISKELKKNYFFESYLNGIQLAEANGTLYIKKDFYSFEFKAITSGITSIFINWGQKISVQGTIVNQELFPNTYISNDFRKNKKGHMSLVYIKNTPFIKSAKPDPRDDERRKISKTQIVDTLDPVSAILSIGLFVNKQNKCNVTKPIFDGKRRYNIIVEYIGLEKILNSSKIDSKATYMKCKFFIKKISGYTSKELKKHPSEGILWYNIRTKSYIEIPSKIVINTVFGKYINYLISN